MSKLRCPYCDAELIEHPARPEMSLCEKHNIGYNWSECTVCISSKTPKYVEESLTLLKHIANEDVWLAYGPFQLFDENFKLKDVIIHWRHQADNSLRKPKVGDVFIAYQNYVALGFKSSLMYTLKLNDETGSTNGHAPSLIDVSTYMICYALEYNVDMRLAPDQYRALTAYIADTGASTAAALLKETPFSIESMSDSSVLASYLYGCKAPLCEKFTTIDLLSTIKDAIIDQAKLCSTDRYEKLRHKKVSTKYLESLSMEKVQKLYELDFSPERLLIKGNEWMFWSGDTIANCSPAIQYCNNDNTFKNLEFVHDILYALYDVWCPHYKVNQRVLQQAASYLGNNPDPTVLYLVYWNIISDRLEKEL